MSALPPLDPARLAQAAESLDGPAWMRALRQQGVREFLAAGFPTRRDEDWKYTDTSAVAEHSSEWLERTGGFAASDGDAEAAQERAAAEVAREVYSGLDAHGLVFVNGRLDTSSLPDDLPQGVRIVPLADGGDDLLGRRGGAPDERRRENVAGGDPGRRSRHDPGHESERDAEPDRGDDGDDDSRAGAGTARARSANTRRMPAFSALNTALLTGGVVIAIDEATALERPLYLLFVSVPGEPAVASPRVRVELGEHARATVVEHYAGVSEAAVFTNVVTELALAEHARLEHYRLQEQPPEALHVTRTEARVAAGAELATHALDTGARLARNDLVVVLAGRDARVAMNGLYFAAGRQHIDNHTLVDHAGPGALSDEDYRGIIDERGRAVFNGKVIVREGAAGTDASQSNRNLLLSDRAEIDTKPELEIYADEVKCAHGATVGQLDETALFYLRSRGIDEASARKLLTFAFAREVLARTKVPALRRRMERAVLGELPRSAMLEELL